MTSRFARAIDQPSVLCWASSKYSLDWFNVLRSHHLVHNKAALPSTALWEYTIELAAGL